MCWVGHLRLEEAVVLVLVFSAVDERARERAGNYRVTTW